MSFLGFLGWGASCPGRGARYPEVSCPPGDKLPRGQDNCYTGPAEKVSILLISHFCIFLLQISKFLHFSCPVVNWWWFSLIIMAFQKVEKIEVFDDCGPVKKANFLLLSQFCMFLIQMSDFFTFEWSCDHLVMIFIILEGFPESRKNWSFRPHRPVEKCQSSPK